MSTRSIIAVREGNNLKGVYHHSDGYPSGVGKTLWNLYHKTEDKQKLTGTIIRLSGWSTLVGWDGKEENIISFTKKEEIIKTMGHDWDSYDELLGNKAVYYDGERANDEFYNLALAVESGWYLYEITEDSLVISHTRPGSRELFAVVPFIGPEPNWKDLDNK